jgi:hypothetical protein
MNGLFLGSVENLKGIVLDSDRTTGARGLSTLALWSMGRKHASEKRSKSGVKGGRLAPLS